jgi:hypothetical protein
MRGLPAVLRQRRQVQASRRVRTNDLRRMMADGWKVLGVGRHLES